MKFPIFASLIVFCLWLRYILNKSNKDAASDSESFLEREAKANSTRRKSLDNLDYITIPLDSFAINDQISDTLSDNYRFNEAVDTLYNLSSQKIVNFTGYTNTDLKLMYGAPNINLLMEFDNNYTLLARTLQALAEELFKAGYIAEARTVLEFAVSTKTDVSRSYFLLADIYERDCRPEKIEELIKTAESLNSIIRNSIVRTLKESGPYSDLLRS